MSYYYYGWIGNTDASVRSYKWKSTDTSSKIKYFAKKLGAKEYNEEGIISKNLICFNDRIYYILSIAAGNGAWAPYPFINKLDDFTLILTRDGRDDGTGELWTLDKETFEKLNLKLISRNKEGAGDYYSLPIKVLKEINAPNYKYSFYKFETDNNENEYIREILEKIF